MDSVSVLMPVRDAGAYLDAAIRSIRTQTLTAFEFIIVDDGSQDGSDRVIAGHAAVDPRIRVITQAPLGIAAALNRGLAVARGTLVARMDADDIALPHRLERQCAVLAGLPDVAVLGSVAEMIDGAGMPCGLVGAPLAPAELRAALPGGNVIVHSSVLIRRAAVQEAGGYRTAFTGCEDYDLWLRLAEHHDLMILPDVLLRYRRHAGQVSEHDIGARNLAVALARRGATARRSGQPDPADGVARIDRALLRRIGLDDSAIAQIMAGETDDAVSSRPAALPAGRALTRPLRRFVRPLARAALRRLSQRDALGPGDAWARRPLARSEWGRDRIFVLIPSYRDTECQWTVRDLFARARHPERISVGIVWQTDPAADGHCFEVETRPEQVRTLMFPPQSTFGCSWARHQGQRLWQGEEYVLQIDSHMRFVDDWDIKMLDQLARCGSPRPLLTTRPLHYDPPDALGERYHAIMTAGDFDDADILHVGGALMPLADAPPQPTPTAFVSGGFVFGPARRMVEVPYDPYVYFIGEEINLSVRLWTAGWDLFVPSEVLIYHYYAPSGTRSLPWLDDPESYKLHAPTVARMLHMLGMRRAEDPKALVDLARYGLGRARSLAAYEAFAGVSFAGRSVSERARRGEFGAPVAH